MKVKALICAFLCYLMWGGQPVYWTLLPNYDSMFLLAVRIIMSFVLITLFLCVTKRGGAILAILRDKRKLRFIIPASAVICLDWGLYIYAVTSGRVVDANIGYYLNPLVIFVFGLLLFREKGTVYEFVAVGVAFAGFVISTAVTGSFPLYSLAFAFVFPLYSVTKKYADADPIASIAVETMLLTPFALLYIALFARGDGGMASVKAADIPALIGSGVVSGLPMILYTSTVNDLPIKLVGILQYTGTTIGMLCGALLLHEALTTSKLILLAFIIVGIIVFTVGSLRKRRKPDLS